MQQFDILISATIDAVDLDDALEQVLNLSSTTIKVMFVEYKTKHTEPNNPSLVVPSKLA